MSEQQYTKLQVGTPFELFIGRNMKGQCGAIIEQLADGGFCLVVYMDNMTTGEFLALREEKIHVRVIKETDDFVLTLLKYGKTPLIFELCFDPTLYKDDRRGIFSKSNMLTIIGVESNTNTIKTLRMVSMPLKLHNIFIKAWNLALTREGFSEKYNAWINDLDSRYSVVDLWKMGENYGQMGQQE
jgi:hypothetical protein